MRKLTRILFLREKSNIICLIKSLLGRQLKQQVRVQVVYDYDASTKNGQFNVSINDCLETGPSFAKIIKECPDGVQVLACIALLGYP